MFAPTGDVVASGVTDDNEPVDDGAEPIDGEPIDGEPIDGEPADDVDAELADDLDAEPADHSVHDPIRVRVPTRSRRVHATLATSRSTKRQEALRSAYG